MAVAIASILMLVLFLISVPIGFAVMGVTLVYFFLSGQLEPMIAVQRMLGGAQSPPLLAIPFFVMLGSVMNYTGIAKRMLNLAEVLTGHLPGGLAQVNVLLATLMGGLSASNLADAAMQTKMLVPEMEKRNYDKGFAASVVASSSLITPIIPPGIALILYGFIADVSIGKMFMAGVIPGLIMCIALMIAVHVVSKKRGYVAVRDHGPRVKEVAVAIKDAFWAIVLIFVIIGGIRVGMFTPTEAGAVAILYVILVGRFAYKETKFSDVKEAFLEATRSTGSIMVIIMGAAAFAWILTWERIASNLAVFITGLTSSPTLFLLIINIFLLIVGMFIEGNAAMIVLVPLVLPTVKALGIDPIHFGLVFIVNMAIGTLTPPMGTVTLLVSGLTGVKIDKFVREMMPFFIALGISLLLVTYIPVLSLWLPNTMK